MRYMDLTWVVPGKRTAGSPTLVRVWIVRERTAPAMRAAARKAFPKYRFSDTLDSACGFYANIGLGTVGDDPKVIPFQLLCVSGSTRTRRVQVAAHEAMHLALNFWRRRRLPKGTEYSREEHACRLMDSLLEFYIRNFESGKIS